MRVLHVIPSLALVHGGPSVALPLMARALKGVGAMVDVVTTDDAGPDRRVAGVVGGWMERDWGRCRFFRKQTEFYKVSGPMMAWLVRHVRGYDVVHVHGLFSFSSTAGALVAWMEGVRYIIRPLGVLNHWGVQNRRRWIKRASMSLLEGRLLRNAFAVHYTSRREQLEAGSLGFGERGVVIPLGVDLRELDSGGVDKGACSFFPELDGCRVVLFLSRLDRKKGLEILLEGFATLAGQASDLRLLVAGDGETGYVEGLKRHAVSLGLAGRVVWAGFLEGEARRAALRRASVYCLPSYSENFGISAVEAMGCGIPCVFSEGVGIAGEAESAGAAVVVPAQSQRLASALGGLLGDRGGALEMGVRGRAWVEREYSLGGMGERLKALYQGEWEAEWRP